MANRFFNLCPSCGLVFQSAPSTDVGTLVMQGNIESCPNPSCDEMVDMAEGTFRFEGSRVSINGGPFVEIGRLVVVQNYLQEIASLPSSERPSPDVINREVTDRTGISDWLQAVGAKLSEVTLADFAHIAVLITFAIALYDRQEDAQRLEQAPGELATQESIKILPPAPPERIFMPVEPQPTTPATSIGDAVVEENRRSRSRSPKNPSESLCDL